MLARYAERAVNERRLYRGAADRGYRRDSISKQARRPCASPPSGRPGWARGFQAKMSIWAQAPLAGAKRCRNRAAVTEPAWAQAAESLRRSAISVSSAAR